MSRTARRSARSCPSRSVLIRVSRQTITTALATSTTESSPNPINAMDPAMMPPTIAMTASRLFQPIVAAVSPHAHRRAWGSVTAGARDSQSHPSPHLGPLAGGDAVGHPFNETVVRVEQLAYPCCQAVVHVPPVLT